MKMNIHRDNVQCTKVLRGVFAFVLCSFSAAFFVPAQAQEAFYIYRNDGDFNGFFYDEVIEMRQSKIGVDSVEYDKWVTQEIVLADTTYRIPLAAIDSIGFQQPEIRFNPRVKFIEQAGLCPYIDILYDKFISFIDIPETLIPQAGDVLIGFPTDPCHGKYDIIGGSFGLVVESVTKDDNWVCAYGRPIDKIGDVFEQYITVEQIGVDKQGNVVRRIAGCTPEGLPRKINKASGSGEVTVIDFTGTLTREWVPDGNSKVDLSADVNLVLKMRAAYNISWTKFYAKLSKDYIMKIKPSIGLSMNTEFNGKIGEWIGLPAIMFPAVCPIFQTNPVPEFFLRAQGTFEARLNMPQVQMGFGEDIIVDSRNLFPISYSMHMVPDENVEPTPEMLDLSGSVTMSGFVQTGIELEASIATASWFKKILGAEIGLHLYVGPKVTAKISYNSSGGITPNTYYWLSQGTLSTSLLSFDLDAGAKAWVGWNTPDEKKFFTKSWEFMQTDLRLAPSFQKFVIETTPTTAFVKVYMTKSKILFSSDISLYVGTAFGESICDIGGGWSTHDTYKDSVFEASIPLEKLKGGQSYRVLPIVTLPAFGTFKDMYIPGGDFTVPITYKVDVDHIHFDVTGQNEQSYQFTTNCSRTRFNPSNYISSSRIDTLDAEKGIYKIVCKGYPNRHIFSKISYPKDSSSPSVMNLFGDGDDQNIYFGMSQDDNDLSNVTVDVQVTGGFKDDGMDFGFSAYYDGKVTLTKNGETAQIEGSKTTKLTEDITYTYNIQLTLTNSVFDSYLRGDQFLISGKIINKTLYNGEQTEYTELHFQNAKGYIDNSLGVFRLEDRGEVTYGENVRRVQQADGSHTTVTYTSDPNGRYTRVNTCSINVKLPGEE